MRPQQGTMSAEVRLVITMEFVEVQLRDRFQKTSHYLTTPPHNNNTPARTLTFIKYTFCTLQFEERELSESELDARLWNLIRRGAAKGVFVWLFVLLVCVLTSERFPCYILTNSC